MEGLMTYHKCNRCGACCIGGCCEFGEEDDDTGLCKELVFETDDTTSCKLVVNGKNIGTNTISIGKGCVLQRAPAAYQYYLESKKRILGT